MRLACTRSDRTPDTIHPLPLETASADVVFFRRFFAVPCRFVPLGAASCGLLPLRIALWRLRRFVQPAFRARFLCLLLPTAVLAQESWTALADRPGPGFHVAPARSGWRQQCHRLQAGLQRPALLLASCRYRSFPYRCHPMHGVKAVCRSCPSSCPCPSS